MSIENLVLNIPTYSKQALEIQLRKDVIDEKLELIDNSSYESAFITDIYVNQLKATTNVDDLYQFLEHDLADTNQVVLPEIEHFEINKSTPEKLYPKIDAVFKEVNTNLRLIEDTVDKLVANNAIIASNANILRDSVGNTSNATTFFTFIKSKQNNLSLLTSNNLLYA